MITNICDTRCVCMKVNTPLYAYDPYILFIYITIKYLLHIRSLVVSIKKNSAPIETSHAYKRGFQLKNYFQLTSNTQSI